jgi:hypothetical protein
MATNNLALFLNRILNDADEWARFRKEPVQIMQAARSAEHPRRGRPRISPRQPTGETRSRNRSARGDGR